MPPALSDYDSTSASDSDCDSPLQVVAPIGTKGIQNESPVARAPLEERRQDEQSTAKLKQSKDEAGAERAIVTSTASKKRKRNNLLAGIELENIITVTDDENDEFVARDALPTPSFPTSSFRTRGQANGMRDSKPVYDQKYHPMDDVVQPSRADRHRARYEEQNPDEDSEGTDFYDEDQADSDGDVSHLHHMNKRRKLSDLPPSQGTRRSSRRVNRDVLYNMSVHPQDEEIEQVEVDSNQIGTSSEEGSSSSPSQVTDGGVIAVGGGVVRDTGNDTVSEQSTSSLPRLSPLSSIALGPLLATGIRLVAVPVPAPPEPARRRLRPSRRPKGPTFRIYEEPLQVQLEREASAPAPIEYPHDDKENPVEGMESEDEADPRDETTVHTASDITEERIGTLDDAAIDYVAPSMFDGSSNRMSYVQHTTSFQPMAPRRASSDEHDAVLGSLSPQRTLDRDCTPGDRHSGGAIDRRARQKIPSGGFALLR